MGRFVYRTVHLILLASLVFGVFSAAAAQDGRSVYISSINTDLFPSIHLKVRVVDSAGQVASGLTDKDIAVYENGVPVSSVRVTAQEVGPAYVIFVFDQGMYSNLGSLGEAHMKDLLLEYQRNFMRDGIDTVSILERVNLGVDTTRVILEPTRSAAGFIDAVQNLSFYTTSQTHGLQGVETAYSSLVQLLNNKPARASTAIIYISRLVENPNEAQALKDIQTMSVKLVNDNVRVYTWHTDRNGDHANVLNSLSASSGGQYLLLQANQDNLPAVRGAYTEIMKQAAVYQVEYRSSVGSAGMRNITVVPAGKSADMAKDKWDVSLNVANPRVTITSPENRSLFKRNAFVVEGTQEMMYDINSITVTANLEPWEDGFSRNIVLAELLVDQQPKIKIRPVVGETRYEFTLDISSMVISGTHSIPFQVRVEDEFGREGVSGSVVADIQVIKPEPIVIINTEVVTTISSACEENPMGTQCWLQRITLFAPWVGLAATGVLLFFTRRQVSQLANNAGKYVKDGAGELRKTILGGVGGPKKGKQLATLHVVVGGKGRFGGEIKIYNQITTLGRDPARSDFQLYDEDEKSTVSGCHCTIMYDQGQFWLTDNNSTNGTQLNNITIIANEPYPLKDRDEIVLGDVFNAGAKLRFEIGEAKGAAQEARVPAQKVTWQMGQKRGATELDFDAEWTAPRVDNKTEIDLDIETAVQEHSTPGKSNDYDLDLDSGFPQKGEPAKYSSENHWHAKNQGDVTEIDLGSFEDEPKPKGFQKSSSKKTSDDWLKELD